MSRGVEVPFLTGIQRVAVGPAAKFAEDVDSDARFPVESIDSLRDAGALSAFVPSALGGDGVSVGELGEACFLLGRSCSATAMVFAMHQIQVACLVRHLDDSPWFADYLRRLVEQQRLIASATSEVGTGGDMTRSVAGIEPCDGGGSTFVKRATTVSYGGHADDLLTTVRRTGDAESSDQRLVLTSREQTQLEQTGSWDPLGMRGTCSPGFVVSATFADEQVLATPFSVIAAETMVPFSHLLWAELWLGIATEAFERARTFLRERARAAGSPAEVGADRLSALMIRLSHFRAEVASSLALFESADAEPGRQRLSTMATALRFNNLKIAASETLAQICLEALEVIGIAGYKNDSPFSVGRQLRDALSAPLMVSNARIHATNASLLLIAKEV